MPDDFIPLAQQTGLIKPLTLYVIDEALQPVPRAGTRQGLERSSIAVNLSTRNLLDLEFPTEVAGPARAHGASIPTLLELEITESTMLADPVRTKLILEQALGAWASGSSIDDFGTGYSSLAYLKRPAGRRDQDRPLVRHAHGPSDDDDATIVRSTIDLGRNLGLEVVAEGVETEEVWNHLTRSAARSRRATTSAARCRRTSCARGSPPAAGAAVAARVA